MSDVITNHERNRREAAADPGRLRVGFSLAKQITNALREEGLLDEDK